MIYLSSKILDYKPILSAYNFREVSIEKRSYTFWSSASGSISSKCMYLYVCMCVLKVICYYEIACQIEW